MIRRWTPDDDATARTILTGGGSYLDVAAALDRTRDAVVQRTRTIGVTQHRDVALANQAAAMRRLADDPAYRQRHREGCKIGWANDAPRREAARQNALARDAMGHCQRELAASPEAAARRLAGTRAALTARAVAGMAWCPEAYRATYRHLVYVKQIGAAEARRMTEVDIARDAARRRAYIRTFEGQLEYARNGGKLVERWIPPTVELAFSPVGCALA